ncbi:D-alanyl-D-alanine carboxypeptidase family protein [Desulfopila sp. IMCC35008]|uniref:D-alanyl-D-alanine carboxypeptidase family protein n=1 Tax=Desulfopila sp. IMCC35008 TaxID=2653858 RepID=UPI0013D1EC58|nr:D-alanyl-D-alanine carboxypeptidase family protein [Desulfopila sp. IMCC35008]
MKRGIFLVVICSVLLTQPAWAGRAKINTVASDPYLSALVIDAGTGKTLVEENSDTKGYPASVLKMMVLLVVLEQVEKGSLSLDQMVQVTPEAARMGGSQVYLDPQEQFSVEDLLYALMIQSANDAAVALAIHISGSKESFIALMNERAAALGMKDTSYYSVHGLPPSDGQQVDITTARDLSVLAMELAKKKETFKYTGTREREFRNGDFIMRTHNHLLTNFDGCDGFKTGYFKAAGFSIVATAKRRGVRLIAVVLGSKDRKVRDAKATELLLKGFSMVPARVEEEAASLPVVAETSIEKKTEPVPNAAMVEQKKEVPEAPTLVEGEGGKSFTDNGWLMFLLGVGVGLVPFIFLMVGKTRKPRRRSRRLM